MRIDDRENVVTFATGTTNYGSTSLFDHEIAHAYDASMGDLSLSPMFEDAFHSDFSALMNASPVDEYFTKRDADSPAGSPRYVRAQKEAYAESFANYYSGKAYWFSDKPALLKYFQVYRVLFSRVVFKSMTESCSARRLDSCTEQERSQFVVWLSARPHQSNSYTISTKRVPKRLFGKNTALAEQLPTI